MTSVVEQHGASSAPVRTSMSEATHREAGERPASSRVRELLMVIAVLAAVAGIGALMVACTGA
jgi:hypothetical protein